jgi:hypothetical protein
MQITSVLETSTKLASRAGFGDTGDLKFSLGSSCCGVDDRMNGGDTELVVCPDLNVFIFSSLNPASA